MNYVYMLQCQDGTFYTGWTNNIEKRLAQHNLGQGARYTKCRLPVTLKYLEELPSKEEAMKREYRVKHLPRLEKAKLIHAWLQKNERLSAEEMAVGQENNDDFKIRFGQEKDVPLVLNFIKELAEYENMLDQVTATEEILRQTLFEKQAAEVIICEDQGIAVGFALFFHNFSTFLGQPGLYLEDLFVKPAARSRGAGKIMLSFLARLAIARGCGRLEWWCLDWNQPAAGFYRKLGARAMDEWTVYRVCDQELADLAGQC